MPEQGRAEPLVARWAKAFVVFWWDFLVGDTPELLIGALVAIAIVAALVRASSLNGVAVATFPALVAVLLCGSALRARRARH